MPGRWKRCPVLVRRLWRICAELAEHPRRFLLADADKFIQPLLKYLRAGPVIEALDVAGSYRRRQETVGDIDILAVCENAPPLMQHFLAYPGIERVEMSGTTR